MHQVEIQLQKGAACGSRAILSAVTFSHLLIVPFTQDNKIYAVSSFSKLLPHRESNVGELLFCAKLVSRCRHFHLGSNIFKYFHLDLLLSMIFKGHGGIYAQIDPGKRLRNR